MPTFPVIASVAEPHVVVRWPPRITITSLMLSAAQSTIQPIAPANSPTPRNWQQRPKGPCDSVKHGPRHPFKMVSFTNTTPPSAPQSP